MTVTLHPTLTSFWSGLEVRTSEESCFRVCVRLREASASALVSREARGSVSSPLCGQPRMGRSSYPKPVGELVFDPLEVEEAEEVGLPGVEGEPEDGRW